MTKPKNEKTMFKTEPMSRTLPDGRYMYMHYNNYVCYTDLIGLNREDNVTSQVPF